MFDRLRRFGRDLTGRSDDVLIAHLIGQLEATGEGIDLARSVADGQVPTATARDRMADIEHAGDDHRAELIEELSRVLAPPIDREDMFRFSRSLDDVLDNLRDLVREIDLYEIAEEPLLHDPLSCVAAGITGLRAAVESLLEAPAASSALAAEAKKNDIRGTYQRGMAQLLAGDEQVTGRTLRRRELLRRVDVVGLRLAEAADALSDGAVKRSR